MSHNNMDTNMKYMHRETPYLHIQLPLITATQFLWSQT